MSGDNNRHSIFTESEGLNMKNTKRMFSLFAALILVVSMFLSVLFIASNIHHDCTGDNCPICEQMQVAGNVLTKLSFAIVTIMIALALCFFTQESMAELSKVITYFTPVKLKVKMLN